MVSRSLRSSAGCLIPSLDMAKMAAGGLFWLGIVMYHNPHQTWLRQILRHLSGAFVVV